MRFFIYSRKSVSTARGESIENQIEMCKNYIFSRFPDTKNANITVYEDEGFSAKSTLRPQFMRMQRDLKILKPDCLVCYRLDRISRNVGDFSAFIEELNSQNVAFICINEDFDTSKPMGKAMMYITSVFAQLERETIAERVRDNMLMLAKTGRWLGGTAPFGFASELAIDNEGGRQKNAYYLKEVPEEIKTVEFIFKSFCENRSYNAVSRILSEKGVLNRNKNSFSAAAIKQILQNPVYCSADKAAFTYFKSKKARLCFDKCECSSAFGMTVYNKRNYSKKNCKRQRENNWIVAKGRHCGIIRGKEWVEVQSIIDKNRASIGCLPSHNEYSLLSGVIYCKKCGSPLLSKRRSVRGTELLFDYICAKKLKGGKAACDCENLSGFQTDDAILKSLAPYITPDIALIYRLLKHSVNCADIFENKSFSTEEFIEILSLSQSRRLIKLAVSRAEWDGERLSVFLK